MRKFALALLLLTLGSGAAAQSLPAVCEKGVEQLNVLKQYTASIISSTRCIESGALDRGNLAISYHNRASAKLLLCWYHLDPDTAEADEVLDSAYDDATQAVTLDPSYGKAFCMRGNILYNLSWGEAGGDDIDKGRSLGMREEDCYLWD